MKRIFLAGLALGVFLAPSVGAAPRSLLLEKFGYPS